MQAEIITIGDEILIGQITDTNSTFLGNQLNKIGLLVYQITTVQDDKTQILKALKEAEQNANIIIITGGLGPTKDDITKQTICEFFNDFLIEDKNVLQNIVEIFSAYKRTTLLDVNKQQALVPSKAKVLINKLGTAPGLWLERNNKVFVCLPGVPYEMKALIKNQVIPELKKKFTFPYITHKTLITYGLGESIVADRIKAWENNLPSFIKLAYLPNFGIVRLRLSAKATDKDRVDSEMLKQVNALLPQIEDIFIGFEDEGPFEVVLGKMLTAKNKTLATAESCTGGNIAKSFTANSGASSFFKGCVVTYATETKIEVLNIPKAIIDQHSVVSKVVAEQMAINTRKIFKTDYAISTTGNAGPKKGDSEAEVGTVWIAIAAKNSVYSEVFNFGNLRERVIQKATQKAFEMLKKEILKK